MCNQVRTYLSSAIIIIIIIIIHDLYSAVVLLLQRRVLFASVFLAGANAVVAMRSVTSVCVCLSVSVFCLSVLFPL